MRATCALTPARHSVPRSLRRKREPSAAAANPQSAALTVVTAERDAALAERAALVSAIRGAVADGDGAAADTRAAVLVDGALDKRPIDVRALSAALDDAMRASASHALANAVKQERTAAAGARGTRGRNTALADRLRLSHRARSPKTSSSLSPSVCGSRARRDDQRVPRARCRNPRSARARSQRARSAATRARRKAERLRDGAWCARRAPRGCRRPTWQAIRRARACCCRAAAKRPACRSTLTPACVRRRWPWCRVV